MTPGNGDWGSGRSWRLAGGVEGWARGAIECVYHRHRHYCLRKRVQEEKKRRDQIPHNKPGSKQQVAATKEHVEEIDSRLVSARRLAQADRQSRVFGIPARIRPVRAPVMDPLPGPGKPTTRLKASGQAPQKLPPGPTPVGVARP